ncbi:adenylosuccinate synthetase [Geomonas sp. Red32]|uniref:adenylosuccinate synthetase n=1 Tax=Geomonas sp. Red32 TaxID=2912856 RepID=UPI00202CF6DC|nr:adenylosuccinate synthetase [Geomonas sp. Red32]MCM0082387.1 adenylosuccinate synthetase [Geomonas sp. Red32]
MKTAKVVIGAALGDEGKGLMTDYFASAYGSDALVVRFNGGGQAGHTVTVPSGASHVFGHIGAGTFAGAPTYLSRFFVVNPLLFFKERDQLLRVLPGSLPPVYADRDALVTTPFDMLLNQAAETMRGAGRHGSCGVGFGETIERCLDPRYRTTVADLEDLPGLRRKLMEIRESYLPRRLAALGIGELDERFGTLIGSGLLVSGFLEDAEAFAGQVVVTGADLLRQPRQLVFEGAQGLLLDETHEWFPHVTRSRTGLYNASILAREAGIESLDVTYVSRAYLTRHGAGPLPFELPGKPYPGIQDRTNIPNPHQGTLRFAWLNLDLLERTIARDLGQCEGVAIRPSLAVTCLDQIDGRLTYVKGGQLRVGLPDDVVQIARSTVGFPRVYVSAGPTRETVTSRSQSVRICHDLTVGASI